VVTDYAGSPAWGDAQYTLALIQQREGRYDDAIAEFEKIFPSPVRDHDLDVNKSDDCKNYRHRTALRISECYVAKHDLKKALEYAQAARDKYTYVSYCKNCLRDNQESIARRIADLQRQLAAAQPAQP
jgi:tetratricopeptide (TPR) repeat protein